MIIYFENYFILLIGLGLRDVVDQILLENPSHYDGIAIMGKC